MALDLASPTSPLFKRWGKHIFAAKTLNTARLTTVPTEVNDIIGEYNSTTLALRAAFAGLPAASGTWESAGDTLLAAIQASFRNTLITMVKEDNQQESDLIEDAVDELIRQMVAAAATIEKSSSVVTGPTVVGSPAGNGTLLCKTTLGTGREAEFALTETLTLECDSESPARFRVRGQAAVGKLTDKWPLGSGVTVNVPIYDPMSKDNRLTNSSFETTDDQELNTPEGWVRGRNFPSSGTAAATLTAVQKQIVFLSGTLASTVYFILDHPDGHATAPLSAAATALQIETALRLWPGWSEVTVALTGSAPLIRHTITQTGVNSVAALALAFSGVTGVNEQQSVSITGSPTGGTFELVVTKHDSTTTPLIVNWNDTAAALDTLLEGVYGTGTISASGGPLPGATITLTWQGIAANRNVELMTIGTNSLTGGTTPTPSVAAVTEGVGVSAAISAAAEATVFHKARAYKVLGNGSAVGAILSQPIALKSNTMYAAFLTVKMSAASPTSGVLQIGLSDGALVSIVSNDEGVPNSFDINLTVIAHSGWSLHATTFQTPKALVTKLHFYLQMLTAYQSGRHLYVDNIVLVEMTLFYPGGPSLAAFQGNTSWKLGDKYTFGIANNRNGEIHEWVNRLLNLDAMGKLLPTAVAPTLADGTFIS